MVHLYGEPQPAVSVAGSDGYLYWRVNPESHEIGGLQYEYFLSYLVYERPEFLAFADLAGVPAEELEAIGLKINPDQRKRAAVEYLLVHSDALLHQDHVTTGG